MRRDYQGEVGAGNSSAPRLVHLLMSKEKPDKKEVVETRQVTPEPDEIPVDPTAKKTKEPKALKTDEPSPRKKGKDGPMQVGVNFDHSGD